MKCPECGGKMYEENDTFECQLCGAVYFIDDEPGEIPEGCAACGGPYPSCMISCDLFDD